MFGNYYVYDSIAPLADTLRTDLGFTSTQVGMLNAIYSAPNIVMVLIGGILVDRFGTRRATLAFTVICLIGALLPVLSGTFPVMAGGRLVFGLGAESMIVAITASLGHWFKGRQLGFALEKVGRGLVSGDIDNDGDLDLLVTNNGQSADLLRNDGGGNGHALLVRTVGKQSNRDGIGARLRVTTGTQSQIREVRAGSSYLGQNDPRQHFGLGAHTRVDRLEIRWPSGRTDVLENVAANQIITVREGDGIVGASPFQR